MDEQNWQKLMKRKDLADKIADALLYGDENEDDGEDEDEDEYAPIFQDDIEKLARKAGKTDDIGKVREALNVLLTERIARQEGEKPADEWKRSDFAVIFRRHKELQKLTTPELRALFLDYWETIAGVPYYRRGSVREERKSRARGEWPTYRLAIPKATVYAADNGDADAVQRYNAEVAKLNKIWLGL